MTSQQGPTAAPSVSARMRRQRRRDTEPEVELRRLLHGMGFRYRVNLPVPGRARRTMDLGFTRGKVAVFVDGCFWHSCPTHATWPTNNADWWREKLLGNVRRDRDTDRALREADWCVVRIWEHEPMEEAARRVAEVVRSRRGGLRREGADT